MGVVMEVVQIALHVVPGARSDAVLGWEGERLWVRVQAPAIDGRANAAVRKLVALLVGVTPSDVTVERGAGARDKLVAVATTDRARLDAALAAIGVRTRSG